jgi:hypothetical protein
MCVFFSSEVSLFFFSKGMDVIRRIENNPTDSRNKPIKEVKIMDCGEVTLALEDQFSVVKADATE